MAIETQYNIVKVNELRPITTAMGNDEIIINDVDSYPLETKKITAENFAKSIKDYILPIAGEGANGVLGGVKIGDGLTINPINGLLSNDVLILDDLDDVIILNAEAGHVLRHNGVQWINEPEGGITNIVAGEGLSGGGYEGEITLDVNAGRGLSIINDAVTVNVNAGLEIVNDYINVRINSGLTFTDNKITIVPGIGLNISNGAVNFVPSFGLEQLGNGIKVDEGKGLKFVGNELTVDLGGNLYFSGNKIDVQDATYQVKGISKFAPVDKTMSEIRGTDSYEKDFVNPKFVDNFAVPTGAVFHFAGQNVPDGFLYCDGSKVSSTTYPALFAMIGVTYNQGDEVGNEFRIPDLRDDFIRGSSETRSVGYRESDRTKKHAHTIDDGSFSFNVDGSQNPITATGTTSAPFGFPTQSSSFVVGYTMNNCAPPHRASLVAGEFIADDLGNYLFDFDNLEWYQATNEQLAQAEADRLSGNPRMCGTGTFPVSVTINGGSIDIESNLNIDWVNTTNVSPVASIPAGDVDETRPRNVALMPCIKY